MDTACLEHLLTEDERRQFEDNGFWLLRRICG